MPPDYEPPPEPPLKRTVLLACIALFAALCWWGQAVTEKREHKAVVPEGPPEVWATDGADAGVIARPMPSGPFKGQKRPPCTGKHEVAIVGGCWVELARKPEEDLCGSIGFHHAGKCYVPVQQAKPLPVGLEP